MNKSLWHSEIFWAACVSVALHACIAGVLVLSISIAAPHFFSFTESPKVLHVSWIFTEAADRNSKEWIQKAGAPLSRTAAPPAPAQPREKRDKHMATTGQETAMRPENQTVHLGLPTGIKSSDVRQTGGNPPMAGPSRFSGAESSTGHESASAAIPRYGDNNSPVYPALARLKGYEGVVLLAAEVSPDGRVGSLRIKKSSGYASLDRSALEAVKRWIFEPGRRMGKPVVMWVDVPVKFVLKEDDSLS